ncbi:hypothetical protein HPB48_003889 [Haemaphysalis longicornis]|uniref:G-protein coupled receptors family 1 profile domain-containing protein n=1 Tax=Haemaphysalis longicornis TaxID=44386 RepID=A0A9J6FEQ2_HAELO|nr:hypothetical protein HPB48_003889 [Haemaphysalis longicornis]
MIKMMIACVAAFLLCWLPLNLFIVVSEQYPSIYDLSGIGYMWFVCHWLAMSHACYNPLIYFWMNAKFRAGLQALFRCLPATRRPSSCFVSTCNVKKAANTNAI